jgi:hypothetical protein
VADVIRFVWESTAIPAGRGAIGCAAWDPVPAGPDDARLSTPPAKNTTGNTGRMHGEIPVISPPTKSISTKDSISRILSERDRQKNENRA